MARVAGEASRFRWAISLVSRQAAFGNAIASDGASGAYIAGSYQTYLCEPGSTDATCPGTTTLFSPFASAGSVYDPFLMSVDGDRNLGWRLALQSAPPLSDESNQVCAPDDEGGVIYAGRFDDRVKFFGRADISIDNGMGSFLLRVRADTSVVWHTAVLNGEIAGVATDGNGGAWAVGTAYGSDTNPTYFCRLTPSSNNPYHPPNHPYFISRETYREGRMAFVLRMLMRSVANPRHRSLVGGGFGGATIISLSQLCINSRARWQISTGPAVATGCCRRRRLVLGRYRAWLSRPTALAACGPPSTRTSPGRWSWMAATRTRFPLPPNNASAFAHPSPAASYGRSAACAIRVNQSSSGCKMCLQMADRG